MTTLVLLATTSIVYKGQALVVQAGENVSDSSVQAALTADGATFAPATDANVAAAQLVVAKLRSHGANEQTCTQVMAAAAGATAYGAVPQHLVIDVPLATIQAATSGTAFAVGSALPAGARMVDADINVITALSGGGATSATAGLEGGSDSGGSIIALTGNVFTGASTPVSTVGSNPYRNRGGQQLKMTITGDGTHALSTLTAGHLSIDFLYVIAP
jgi:hypothetical protein